MNREIDFFGDNLFANLQESQCFGEENSLQVGQIHKPEDPTQMCESISFVDLLHTSSLQMGQRNYTISFEDNYMEQHENAFKIQTQNFMESSIKEGQLKNLSFENEIIFEQDTEFGSFKNPEDILLTFENLNDLIESAKEEENLEKFYNFIFESAPKKVASEMLYICGYAFSEWNHILMNYKKFESEIDVVRQAKRVAEKFGEKLFKDEKIVCLNFVKAKKEDLESEEVVLKAFKSLIEFLLATIGLIGSGFFNNPYSQNDRVKRNRSISNFDHEEEFTGAPRKKMH